MQHGSGPLLASAALVNFTIDDTSSLITYLPPDKWRSSTEACSTCLQPNALLAYAGTWHDGTSTAAPAGVEERSEADADEERKHGAGDEHDGRSEGSLDDRGAHSSPFRRAKRTPQSQHKRELAPFVSQDEIVGAETVDQPLSAVFNFTGTSLCLYYLVKSQFCRAASTNGLQSSEEEAAARDQQLANRIKLLTLRSRFCYLRVCSRPPIRRCHRQHTYPSRCDIHPRFGASGQLYACRPAVVQRRVVPVLCAGL